MRNLFTYGAGIPRYLALWLPLAPLLVAGLVALRVHRGAIVAVLASTIPTFFLHNPPRGAPYALRWLALVGVTLVVLWWLVLRVRDGDDEVAAPEPMRWPVVLALVALSLAVRVPLAWLDPGVGDFALSSEHAARTLMEGTNPYTVTNPHATYGTYQYPAGTLLAHVPFVALDPGAVLGEEHLGARAVLWVTDAAVVVLLAWAGARAGHARGGLAAAFAYAVHPTVVRESGIVVANDLLLAALVTGVAVALARDRRLLAGVLTGLAVAVKPTALLLVPVVLVAGGWMAAACAVLVPAALQAPFLLWPRPGAYGLRAMAEPVARGEPLAILEYSTWYPLYALRDGALGAVRFAAVAGLVVATAAAGWAGVALRRGTRTIARCAAAVAVPFVVAFFTASVQRHNYQDWYLAAFLLAVGLSARRAAAR